MQWLRDLRGPGREWRQREGEGGVELRRVGGQLVVRDLRQRAGLDQGRVGRRLHKLGVGDQLAASPGSGSEVGRDGLMRV